MEIITKLSTLDIDDPSSDNLEDTIKEVFTSLQEAFAEQALYKETYLYENFGKEHFHFGSLEPEYVKGRTEKWLGEIKNAFITALDAAYHISTTGRLPTEDDLLPDSAATYQICCAARELDNNWCDYAEHAVYLENSCGYPYFRVLLTDEEKEDIISHPENYVIVDAYVKG